MKYCSTRAWPPTNQNEWAVAAAEAARPVRCVGTHIGSRVLGLGNFELPYIGQGKSIYPNTEIQNP